VGRLEWPRLSFAAPLSLRPRHAGSRPFDVVGFGQNSVDLVAVVSRHAEPDSHTRVDQFAELPGGEIATAMVACARLGCRARYVGAIGSNSHGALIRGALERAHVDVAKVRRVEAPNRLAIILVDPDGRRTVLWHRDARLATSPAQVDVDAVTSGRVLLVDAIDPAASTVAAHAARQRRIPTVIDIDAVQPGVDLLLGEIDIIIAAGAFPEALTGATSLGAGLQQMAERYHRAMIVATLGAEGTLTRLNGRELRTPALAVDVVDTTGAGDAFRGGFIASWLRLGNQVGIETILEYASVVAALNCRAVGAQAGLPTWTEVEQGVTRAAGGRSN
jgi:sulfofructose kinase